MQKLKMGDLVSPESIVVTLDAATKKDALQALAAQAASVLGMDAITIFDVLWGRESLGTTGVGQGIAIPHGRVPGLTRVAGFFARMAQPIDFESVDGKPVDLVFMLLAPEAAGADHLHALASVSRVLRDSTLCEQLRGAKDAKAAFRILTETEIAQAA